MDWSRKSSEKALVRAASLAVCLGIIAATSQAPLHAQSLRTNHLREPVASGSAKYLRRLPSSQSLRLHIMLPMRDQAGLDQFLREVYDPQSPSYRNFLSPSEFAARFGASQEDYQALTQYAEQNALTIVGGSFDGMDLQVEASVASIELAFHVAMGVYQHPTENRTFYSPDREPTVGLPFTLWHVSGLDDYSTPHSMLMRKSDAPKTLVSARNVAAQATTGSGPSASYLGSDMRAAYYGGTALTGAGQNLGLLEFNGTDLADVTTYLKNANQTSAVPITLLSTDGSSTACLHASGCDDTEQTLDITQALGMAPGLASLVVYVGASDTAMISAMTTHSPLPTAIGCSWGWTPADPTVLNPYFQRMAAQGQNFFAASGDSSTWSSKNEAWPADNAYVVAVGGTDLVTAHAGGVWQSETAWADSGGGISPDSIAIPSWQQLSGVINASNKGSTTLRNGPDVSANANFTFYVCANQTTCTANEYGGTSFAAPMWAGYMALVNQQAALNGHSTVGFINPAIYSYGTGSSYATYFHDVTTGTSGSYSATTGYDLVTGWGSPNGSGLITGLASLSTAPNFTISASPSSISVAQGSTGTSTVTTAVSGGFSAAIVMSASGMPTGMTAAFSPASVALPGAGSSVATFTVGSSTLAGTYSITVSGTGGGLTHTATVSVTVTVPTFSIAASPTTLSVIQGAKGTSTISTTVAGGFNSAIAMTASGLPTGTTAAFSPTSIAAPGAGSSVLTLTAGTATPAGTYSITITGTGRGLTHTAAVSLTVTVPVFSIAASPASLTVPEGSSGASTVTTTVGGGFNSAIAVTASGLPTGATAAFSPASIVAPGSGSSTVTFTVGSSTPAGTYSVTLTGTGGGITHTATVSLTVTVPVFSIAASPAALSLVQGARGTSTISTTVGGGFNSAIAMTASGLPTGATAAFSPTSISAPGTGSSVLTLTAGTATPAGTYAITITGTGGGITHTATVSLTVTVPAFTIAASPTALSVVQGAKGTSTISTTVAGGFSSAIAMTASGLPTGTTAAFSPASIAAPGSGSSVVTLTVGTATPVGTYTVTITGTGGGLTHPATISLTVKSH